MFNFFKNRKIIRNNRKLSYTLVSSKTAREMILNNEVILIDVRNENEYNSMHIRNAINIPVKNISNIKMYIKNINYNTKIMPYCSTGTRSKEAINILNKLGYTNIFIWEYASIANFGYKNMIEYNKK